jgi:hypothetical protein
MKKPKHRILFKGYYNVHNFGDDLLFLALLDFFQNQMAWGREDVRIFIEPEEESLRKLGYEHPYRLLPYLDPLKQKHLQLKKAGQSSLITKASMLFFMIGCLLNALIYRVTGLKIGNKKNIRFFSNLDIIHYIGGGYFNTRLTWGTQLLIYELFFTTLAKLINPNLQIIGTGLGIGPVTTGLYKALFKEFAKKFNYIFVREKESETFVKALGTSKHVQCIGDDVVLLFPYFQKISKSVPVKNQIGLNLKFDKVHHYGQAESFFNQLFERQHFNKEEIVFFNFGRDHLALRDLPSSLIENISIQSCYEKGLKHFTQELAASRTGIGFAYHFAILCALMNIPSANIYFDDYYRQKTGGVIQLLCNQHLTLSYQKLPHLTPEELFSKLDSVDQENVPAIFEQLRTAYKGAYEHLESSRVAQ